MKNISLISFFYTLLLLISPNAQSNQVKPPILDFIPNCKYEVLKVITDSENAKQPKSKKVIGKVLSRLQNRAKRENADALILTKRTIKVIKIPPQNSLGNPVTTYQIKFTAELIKQCKETDSTNRKRSKFDKNGKIKALQMSVAATTFKERKIVISRNTIARPVIDNNTISLAHGIYGVKLGSTYEQLTAKFGQPSAVLTILEDEVIAGYGRRHWFHFQANKLVKVESKNNFLSREITNQIPFLDYFDDYSWQINNKAVAKMSLSEAKSALGINQAINKHKQLILNDNDEQLILGFNHSRNRHTKKDSYTLSHFTLQTKHYKANKLRKFAYKDTQFQQITDLYKNIKAEKAVDFDKFLKDLGEPLGQISLPQKTILNIYNPNLLITTKNSQLTSLNLVEQVFLSGTYNKSTASDWFLDNYKSGMSLDAAHKFFPEDAFELYDKFEISTDDYALYLSFDEAVLYEAEIKL